MRDCSLATGPTPPLSGAPSRRLLREGSEFIGGEDEKLAALLSSSGPSAARRWSREPIRAPAVASALSAYVAIDLSDAAAVASALRLMRVLRQVDTAVDTTVVGLTARTAANGSAGDNAWFETWKLLLEQLGDGPFAQRVYLLDGCDADKTWFERPEQLHRLGAEFLFYHGLTCRGLLRQNERARTGAHESLLNVCGSFGCRTIEADLSVVAERVAERLAREDLADLYQRTVPSGWLASLQEQSRLLVDRIATICERTYQARGSAAGERRDRPDARHGRECGNRGGDSQDGPARLLAGAAREPLSVLPAPAAETRATAEPAAAVGTGADPSDGGASLPAAPGEHLQADASLALAAANAMGGPFHSRTAAGRRRGGEPARRCDELHSRRAHSCGRPGRRRDGNCVG